MNGAIRSPLFIFGFPRSGTTLLRSILNAHPEIRLVNEPDLIPSLRMAGFGIWDRLNRSGRERFLQDYGNSTFGKRHLGTLPPERARQFAERVEDFGFREAFEFLLPRPDNVPVWGAKTLRLGFYLPDIRAMFPNALCISLIRDPRAAILSLYRKRRLRGADEQPRFERKTISFFAYNSLLWCEWIRTARQMQRDLGSSFVRELRFEDFVAEPKANVSSLCAALGVPQDPRMLDKMRRAADPVATPEFDHAHSRITQDVDARRADACKELPAWATYVVEHFARNVMQELGYKTGETLPSAPMKLLVRARLAFMTERLRRKTAREIERRLEQKPGPPVAELPAELNEEEPKELLSDPVGEAVSSS
jgi:hypothetical protein